MKKLGFVLGIIAGLIIILTGILTALKITPAIFAVGLEVALGIWRIFAGSLIIVFAYISRKNIMLNWVIVALGVFEIIIFLVEKDYTLLTIGPPIAILAGTLGLIKK